MEPEKNALDSSGSLFSIGAFGSIIFIGLIDFLAGSQFILTLAYLIPVLYIAKTGGMSKGMLAATAGMIIWVIIRLSSSAEYHSMIHPAVDAIIIWGIFALLLYIVTGIRTEQKQQQQNGTETNLSSAGGERDTFRIFLAKEIKRAARYNRSLTLAYIDISETNAAEVKPDMAENNKMVLALAETVKKNLRASDTISRLSDSEISVLLPETNQKEATVVMAKVKEELGNIIASNRWNVTFNIGVVTCLGKSSIEELEKEANQLVNQAIADDTSNLKSKVIIKEFSDIRVLGIAEDRTNKVYLSPNKYNVYFKLSDNPPIRWEEFFDHEKRTDNKGIWTHFWLEGQYLVAQCALNEIQQSKIDALRKNLEIVNKKYRESLKEQEAIQLKEQKELEEESKRRHEVFESLSFGEE